MCSTRINVVLKLLFTSISADKSFKRISAVSLAIWIRPHDSAAHSNRANTSSQSTCALTVPVTALPLLSIAGVKRAPSS